MVGERQAGATFAGREAEIDLLCSALEALDTTGARTVLIGGEAGIGKTRLVEEFGDRARATGAIVVTGVCTSAEGGGLPYGPVVGMLRELARAGRRHRGRDPRPGPSGIGADRRSLAGCRRRRGALDTQRVGQDPSVRGTPALLPSLAERSRVVVVFEDLHWADSASVEVVDFLARNLGSSPLLLLGTYRPGELDQGHGALRMLAELGRHRAVSRVELTGLDRDATAVLMDGILGHEPDWVLLEAVHARSEGNPFFAEELTAARARPRSRRLSAV